MTVEYNTQVGKMTGAPMMQNGLLAALNQNRLAMPAEADAEGDAERRCHRACPGAVSRRCLDDHSMQRRTFRIAPRSYASGEPSRRLSDALLDVRSRGDFPIRRGEGFENKRIFK